MTEIAIDSWVIATVLIFTSLIAGVIRGISGFGGPAIMLLVLTQFFDPAAIFFVVVIADYCANMQLVVGSFRQARWRKMIPLILSSLIAIPLGLHFLEILDPVTIKRTIATIVGICAVVMLTGWRYRSEPPQWITIIVGFLGGAIVGLTYIALPVMIFIFGGSASAVVARANAIAWGGASSSLIVLLGIIGGLGAVPIFFAVVATVTYMLGAWGGARLFRYFSERTFRRFVLYLLIFLSILGILL